MAGAVGEAATDLSGDTGIMDAAAAIAGADCFIGNDSGLMHLSEAVGVPVVALFGPTVEAFGYYPTLARSKVIERRLSCRPCSRNGKRTCPKGTQECLMEIPVTVAADAFEDFLNERGSNRYVVD